MQPFTSFLRVMLAAFCVSILALPAQAQQYTIAFTTLNGVITDTATSLVLTSAAASAGSSFGSAAVGQCLFVESELMRITAVAGTTMTVRRDASARPTRHATLVTIWRATCDAFMTNEPPVSNGNGSCSTRPAPWINVRNGNVWWCNTNNNQWSGTNHRVFTYNSVPTAQ